MTINYRASHARPSSYIGGRKQLVVSLPAADYLRLRELAAIRKLPMGALVRRAVMQHLCDPVIDDSTDTDPYEELGGEG